MPTIKTKRSDILRRQEILTMIQNAETIRKWLPACLAILWAFGKRITEVLQLKRESVYWDENYLCIRFLVLKKRTRKDTPLPKPFVKKLNRQHPATKIIIDYAQQIPEGSPLFPGMYRQKARYYLRKVTQKAWFHLFRESLATEMAEHGATEEELMHWFDWDRVDTAHDYVKRGTRLTEKWSERTW